MSVSQGTYDVCIIGAGVAGSSLAAYLGSRGYRVAVVERNWSEPDEIIGELLQPGGVQKLRDMGFEEALEGIDAQEVTGYAMFLEGEQFHMAYGQARQGVSGVGFRYGKFIQSLRSLLVPLSSVDRIHGRALSLWEDDRGAVRGLSYQPGNGGEPKRLSATLTVICQGSHGRLRKGLAEGSEQITGFMLGLVLKDAELPYPGHGHVFIGDPAPVLAYPVGTGKVRVLVDFPKSKPPSKGEQLNAHLRNEVAPFLAPILRPAFLRAVGEGQFKAKPTAQLAARPIQRPGVVLLGDALNARHPTTGGGMTVALTDVHDLGSRLEKLGEIHVGHPLDRVIAEFYKERHKANATVNILAYALYQVFCHAELRRACFDYLRRGGRFAAEPMSILSALSRDQRLLLKHFMSVAVFGMKRSLTPLPTLDGIAHSHGLLRDAFHIIHPLLRDERPDRATRVALDVGNMIFPEKTAKTGATP